MKDKFISWEDAVQRLKAQPEQSELVRACFYDDPLQESVERYYKSSEWQAVQEVLSPGKPCRALDVGAGRGISTYALARDGWDVTALEPNASDIVGSGAIKQLIRPGLAITIAEEYGESLPFKDNYFDLVYGRAVFHHAQDPRKFCQEAARVLKKNGTFLITREHVLSRKKDLQEFLDSHPLHSLYGGENAFLLSEYKDAITGAGLFIKKVFGPYDSYINLFPSTMDDIRKKIVTKIGFSPPNWAMKTLVLPLLNKYDNTPGRLYSFWGTKG